MKIEISIAEIVDKLTILSLKRDNISDPIKLKNIQKEHDYLLEIVNELNISPTDIHELLDVNNLLWKIEDQIRDKERNQVFDEDFIQLARNVYITNDIRAEIKKKINLKYSSEFIEEKSYTEY